MPDRRMSAHGRALLAQWEGVELHEYLDASNLPTIGVGHLIRHDEERTGMLRIDARRVPYKYGISREDAMALLGEDLRWAESVVNEQVKVELEQHQFDALVSFAFNIGSGRFIESTLLKCVNSRNFDAVPAQFLRWVNAAGRRMGGLVNRREHEIALWEGKL